MIPPPGKIFYYDYREDYSYAPDKPLRCIQWNIERGYMLDSIIRILQSLDADIICLQELDIHCERSDNRNNAEEIAKHLKMNLAFVAEFEEIHSEMRKADAQGGGVHGNAILSRFDMKGKLIFHDEHAFDWETSGHTLNEPRVGERLVLACEVMVPDLPILCYSAHLEIFTGIVGRLKQFSDILEHAHKNLEKFPHQLLFGDFNTMAHSIARLSSKFCRDSLRWKSLGWTESEYWNNRVISFFPEHGRINYNLQDLALDEKHLVNLRNPHFYDPFHPNFTSLISYFGLYQGKLDWTLVRGFVACQKGSENDDYSASDHKLLWVDLVPILEPSLIPLYAETQIKKTSNNFLKFMIAVSFAVVAGLSFYSNTKK